MRRSIVFLIILVSNLTIVAQVSNLEKAYNLLQLQEELTFSFQVNNNKDVDIFSRDLSVVNYNDQTKTVTAWANSVQFNKFLSKEIPFNVLDSENDLTERLMSNQVSDIRRNDPSYTLTFPLTAYPTYADYVQQMTDFENLYPNLCEVVNIGSTTEGDKHLLFLKISDNIATNEQEPRLMYTSSMHGDEITGYPMMLDLINYFLTAYNDTGHADHLRIKNLLDNSEIWINPNANPDGTYYNDPTNTSVANARRANDNNVDLNRNYPDPSGVLHPDNEVYQTETLAFMALAESTHFVIAANFHGGVEVVNYPWDYTYDRHPDDLWWIDISREYADNAQADGPAGYMDFQNDGITHGADWYVVNGGRQDYMNFENQCKELTIELSNIKKPEAALLDDFWNYNQEALIDYLIQGTYGFRGVVKDANTNTPIEATIKVIGHDDLGSWVISELPHGDYYRPIKAGAYDLIFESPCYESFTLENETIADFETKVLADVLLIPISATPPTGLVASNVNSNSAIMNWEIGGEGYDLRYRIFGSPLWTDVAGLTTNTYSLSGLSPSTQYEVQVNTSCNASSSAYSSSVIFNTTAFNYCDSSGNNISEEYIGNVDINGFGNNTSVTTLSGYSNFTGASIFPDLEVNSTDNTIAVTKHWTGTLYNEAVSAWIDFNQNGTFEASENILETASSQINPVSNTFTVPAIPLSQLGNTRMRVILKYYNSLGEIADNPCENGYSYGETEDYTVNIIDPSLGLENPSLDNTLVYPNPFDNSLVLKLPTNFIIEDIKVTMYDVRGRETKTSKNYTNNSITITGLNNLSLGTYFLKIVGNTGETIIKKVIKH